MLYSILSGITGAITSAIGDYGLYAVFLAHVRRRRAALPSEVVMVYAGAVAAGTFADQDVVLAGRTIDGSPPTSRWPWLGRSGTRSAR